MESHSEFYKSLKDSDNGFFTVESREGKAWLCVHPPGSKGKPVSLIDVMARLELFKLSGYDSSIIQEYVISADGVPHEICTWEEGDPVDAAGSVEISENGMIAVLRIIPPLRGGRNLSAEELYKLAENSGIVFGLLSDVIDHIAAHPPIEKNETVIAKGNEAKEGKNAFIKHAFDVNPRAIPEEDASSPGRVDFRKLNVIQCSGEGQILAEILPGVPGEEGINVLGEVAEIIKPARAKLIAGRNCTLSEDGIKMYANISGHVRISHDPEKNSSKIDVEEILELEDVDYSTGHIDFPGTVRIHGTVLDGFEVKASGDIFIEKSVGNVRLSSGGEIMLSGGIVSRGSALVTSAGDVYARYIQGAGVHAHGSIFIEESAMHARLTAGGCILIVDGRGELIGGETLCAEYLKVKKLGAKVETLTRVIVGLDPEAIEMLRGFEESYIEKKNTLARVQLHISQIEEYRKNNPEAAKREDETYEKLLILKKKYENNIKSISSQMSVIETSIKPNVSSYVEALESIYPGVEINFGMGIKSYRVENRPVHKYCRFSLENGRIALGHS